MDVLGLVAGGVAGLAGGVFVGLRWGARLREQPTSRYWAANAAMLIAGMLVSFGGSVWGIPAFWTGGVGLMAGGLTGLKYGLGRSVGLWRVADRLTGSGDSLDD